MGIFLGDKPVSVYFNGTNASVPVQGVFLGGIQVFPTGTAATVPGAPTWDGTPPASGGDQFDHPFLTPADDGGSEITGYNIYVDDELIADNQDPAALFAVATFAAPGTYEIAVAAVNAVGEGPRLTTVYEFVED
jgi:hypothetical protein